MDGETRALPAAGAVLSRIWRPGLWIVVGIVTAVSEHNGALPVAGLLLVGGAAALTTRWVAPVPVRVGLLLVTAATGLVAMLIAPQGLGPVGVLVAASVGPRLLPRGPMIGLVVVLTVGFGAVVAVVGHTPYGALAGLAVPLLAARTGDRAALSAERDRATALLAELEERRDADLHAAALGERARIARDLHDVLAHTLSGLSLQLQAIRAVVAREGTAPVTVTDSLDLAADLARTGLDEAKQAVAALREPPAPGAERLHDLVRGRPDVHLALDGPFDDLGPAVREAAFATVREALTNAGRHAPGAAVGIRVHAAPPRLDVRVHDEGGSAAPRSDEGAGLGLVGLRERAAGAGGTITARPDAGGWTVTLRVPEDRPGEETP